jgi:hypothetical protein
MLTGPPPKFHGTRDILHIGTKIHLIHNHHFRPASTKIINRHIAVRLMAQPWRLRPSPAPRS